MRDNKKFILPVLLVGILCSTAAVMIAPTFARYEGNMAWQGVYQSVTVSSNLLDETALVVACEKLSDENLSSSYEIQLKTDGGQIDGEFVVGEPSSPGVSVTLEVDDNLKITEEIAAVSLNIELNSSAETGPVTVLVQLKTENQTLSGVFSFQVEIDNDIELEPEETAEPETEPEETTEPEENTESEYLMFDNSSLATFAKEYLSNNAALLYYQNTPLVLELADAQDNSYLYIDNQGLPAYTRYSYEVDGVTYNVVLGYQKVIAVPAGVASVELNFSWADLDDDKTLTVVQGSDSYEYSMVLGDDFTLTDSGQTPVLGYEDSLTLTASKTITSYTVQRLVQTEEGLLQYEECEKPPNISASGTTITISTEGNQASAGTYRLVMIKGLEQVEYQFYINYNESLAQVVTTS